MKYMVGDITLEPLGVPDLHQKMSGTSSKVRKCSWWMTVSDFSILEIKRSVIHQIMNVLHASGMFLITHYQEHFFDILVLYIRYYVFSRTNMLIGSVLRKDVILTSWIRKVPDHPPSGRFLMEIFFGGNYECDLLNCMYFLWQIYRWGWQIPKITK